MNTKNAKKIDLSKVVFHEINSKKETRDFWNKYHQFTEKCFRELFPNDSIPGRDIIEKDFILGWSGYHKFDWIVFENSFEEKIIARYLFVYVKSNSPSFESNKNNSYFYIIVDNDFRRQGLGTYILSKIAKKLVEKVCVFTETDTYYQSGKDFCKKYGAKLINQQSENRLYLKDVDWEEVTSWLEEAKKSNPDVTLECFTSFPEKDMEELCTLETELEAQMPSLEGGDEKWTEIHTPETRREWESNTKKRGQEAITMITREANGDISGITEIRHSHIEQIERIAQRTTGVKLEFRRRGLGKWLKSEMLVYIKNNLPKAGYIVTGNADHNAPMNSINQRLGFKPFYHVSSYKFTLSNLQEKLTTFD